MEGTRHEKILLVIMAYIIGFVNAFIAFSVDVHDQHKNKPDRTKSSYNESTRTQQPVATPAATEPMFDTTTEQVNGVFYVVVNDERRRLSVNLTLNPQAATVIESGLGGYYEPIINSVSPDGRFVFYCERLAQGDELCTPFMYSVEDKVTYMLSSETNKQLEMTLSEDDVRWQPNNVLIVDDYRSNTQDRPWRVVAR